jgi:hypothetical protein
MPIFEERESTQETPKNGRGKAEERAKDRGGGKAEKGST